ncbi:GGDEF domain-containing protein [Exiguobacterium sp. R-17]|uniref:GGDEF domain-containing protein n=1 Tax=Exiguobacterium sp. R-17 TaxID=3404054 RepID=UPI003CEB801E
MMLATVNIFFINICIIFLVSTFAFYLLRDRLPIQPDSMISTRLYFGFANGITGILLMHHAIDLNGALIDLRLLPLALSALFGGNISITVTGLMLLIYRFLIDNGDSINALLSSVMTLLGFLMLSFICRRFITRQGYFFAAIVTVGSLLVLWRLITSNSPVDAWRTIYIPYFVLTIGGAVLFYRLSLLLQQHFVLYSYQSYLASTDQLTRLANRHVILEKVTTLEKNRASWGVILFDLDHFKSVNDTHGHAVGDAVLRHFSIVLNERCPAPITVGRYGGEEFIVIIPDCDLYEPIHLAETIVAAVQQTPFVMQDHAVSITVSAGIAYAHHQPAETVFKQADAALYEAKTQGRNQYRLYQS